MSEPDDNGSGPHKPVKRSRKLKATSMLRLSIGRPRLPIGVSRVLGWFVFIVLAVLPLCLAAATVLYLHSSRRPTDFSARLSHSMGLTVSVTEVTGFGQSRLHLADITISRGRDLPPFLRAESGTYHTGEAPTLSLTNVQLELNLDWWGDPEAIPQPQRFARDPSGPPAPVVDLSDITVQLTMNGCRQTIKADAGLASLKQGLLRLELVQAAEPWSEPIQSPDDETTPKPHRRATGHKVLSARLGYERGKLVKSLTLRHSPPELLRDCLRKALGTDWTSAFVKLNADLTIRQPVDGTNWLINGSATFDPSLLARSVGLSGLTGEFEVRFKHVSGMDGYLRQGVFEITLSRSLNGEAICSVEALKGLQLLATATEPLLAAGVDQLPFDRAGAVVTVTPHKVYIQPSGQEHSIISNADIPILKFAPQQMTRQELIRRLLLLRTLWAQLRVS